MKWAVGEKVMAKWPGSALYFPAQIQSLDGDEAEVLFNDGTVMEISVKSILAETRFTPRKRSKSPSRSRRRSRSPGRSPNRKSAIVQKNGSSPLQQRSRSGSRGRPANVITSSSEVKKAVISGVEDQRNVTQITLTTTEIDTNQSGDTRLVMTRQRTKTTVKSSVEDEELSHAPNHPSDSLEYGGVLGTSMIYLVSPVLYLIMLLVCSEANWSISEFKRSMIPRDFKSYVNVKVIGLVLAYLLFHAILLALPLGHINKGPAAAPNGARLDYRISGRYALVISALSYGGMSYYFNVPFTYVHDHLFLFAFTLTILCFVGNFLVYILSFYVPQHELNPAGDTGSLIYDSFIGRLVHPRIGKLFDLKMYLYRFSMAAWMLLVWIPFHSEYVRANGSLSPQFVMVAISQMVYIYLEFFYDEDQCVFMFDIKDESLGFPHFIGELIMVPFIYSFPVRYVLAHPTKLSPITLATVALIFCIGMIFVSASGRQKCRFRKNPSDPSVSHLESLSSSRLNGDRLLVSGFWGFVRHPNYFGEIMIGLAWSFACGFKHPLVWFYPLFVIVLLCDRANRVEKRCAKKHGHAWKIYCRKVKYRVCPGVF